MRTLGLVVARGGSKGIPQKNVRELAGRPLLAHTAEAGLAARRLDRCILSTDSEWIAEVGRECGLDVPFMRPAELARDDTPTLPVVEHTLRELAAAGDTFDAVCLLQPTHPLRTAVLIDRCIERLDRSDADSVLTVCAVPHTFHPNWTYLERNGRLELALGGTEPIPRRQELPPAYHREGSVYVTRTAVVLSGSLYGAHSVGEVVPAEDTVNLDTEEDWTRAEQLLARRAERP